MRGEKVKFRGESHGRPQGARAHLRECSRFYHFLSHPGTCPLPFPPPNDRGFITRRLQGIPFHSFCAYPSTVYNAPHSRRPHFYIEIIQGGSSCFAKRRSCSRRLPTNSGSEFAVKFGGEHNVTVLPLMFYPKKHSSKGTKGVCQGSSDHGVDIRDDHPGLKARPRARVPGAGGGGGDSIS